MYPMPGTHKILKKVYIKVQVYIKMQVIINIL